jgi:hypothetical protein
MMLHRYVGGEPNGQHVVHDTWANETVEVHPTQEKCMERVVELNQVYIGIENAVRGE